MSCSGQEGRQKIPDLNSIASLSRALDLAEDVGQFGSWSWSVDSDEFHWSPGMFRILGVDPRTPPTFELYKTLVHPDDRLDFSNPARIATDGTLAERLFRILRPNGEVRWIRSSGRLIHSPEGAPLRMIGVAFDVTDARRGTVALRKHNGLLDSLRELFGVVIWETEADGTVSDPVDWRRAVGRDGGDAKGWGRLEAVRPSDRAAVRAAWDEAITNRRRYQARYHMTWQGQEVEVASRASAIRDADGEVHGWVGFSVPSDKLLVNDLDQEVALMPDLIRAARAYLDWSVNDLAVRTGLSFSTIRRAESDTSRKTTTETLVLIRRTFEAEGLQFISNAKGYGIIRTQNV